MKTEQLPTDKQGFRRATELLLAGEVVAFPTETVYGLGAVATEPSAVERIFTAKGRPSDRPVIVHLALVEELGRWGRDLAPEAWKLADRFWPGPLTLVVPRAAHVADVLTGGRDTVGLRVPSHPVAARLLQEVNTGLAAPSANRYGAVSPTTAAHVLEDLEGRISAVLDGGPCAVGLESTIVEITGPSRGRGDASVTLLRHGGIPQRAIEDFLGRPVADGSAGTGQESRASGMVASHYSPNAPVRIVGAEEIGDAPERVAVVQPRDGSDDADFAARLYAELRAADALNPTEIWIVPPSSGELLPAIMDRLRRASA